MLIYKSIDKSTRKTNCARPSSSSIFLFSTLHIDRSVGGKRYKSERQNGRIEKERNRSRDIKKNISNERYMALTTDRRRINYRKTRIDGR